MSRPFVDPNDRYSYEDWMNDMATKDADSDNPTRAGAIAALLSEANRTIAEMDSAHAVLESLADSVDGERDDAFADWSGAEAFAHKACLAYVRALLSGGAECVHDWGDIDELQACRKCGLHIGMETPPAVAAGAVDDNHLRDPFPRVHSYDPSGQRRTVTVQWGEAAFVSYVRYGDRSTWREIPPSNETPVTHPAAPEGDGFAARTVESIREAVQILADGNIDKGQAIAYITDSLKTYDLEKINGNAR